MEAVAKGECKPFDAVLIIYITTNMDNAAGDTVRKVDTMAAKLGAGRSKIFESLARLEAAGLIERRRSFGRHGRQLATNYLIGSAVESFTRRAARPAHRRPKARTPGSRNPDPYGSSQISPPSHGGPGQNAKSGEEMERPPAAAPDWGEVEEWLWQQVGYRKLYSDASRSDAAIDLRHLRQGIGDQALAAAVHRARQLRLYGRPLLDYLENTRPVRRRAA